MNSLFKKEVFILLAILFIAAGVRLFRLDSAPVGAHIDEVHFGYLAYSIGETARDEHGKHLPIIFKGFGDDKLPFETYVLVPVVKLFGLNNISIRIPSVLAGVGIVLMIYLLARELSLNPSTRLLAALVTAISPWSFFLSRFGFESNLGLFLFILALLSMFVALRTKKDYWVVFSLIAFGLTWYAYIAFRPVSLVFVIVFSIFFAVKIKKSLVKTTLYLFIFGLTVLPLALPSTVATNTTRLEQVGILSDPGLALRVNENRSFCITRFPKLLCYAANNKPVMAFDQLVSRYFSALSPNFLFLPGERGPRMMNVQGFGQLQSVLLPLYIIGLSIVILGKSRLLGVHKKILLLGLLLAPIPAAFVGDPQIVRLSVLFPFIVLATAIGFDFTLSLIASKDRKNILATAFVSLVAAVVIVQSGLYFVSWFGVQTTKNSHYYQSYVPELVSFIENNPDVRVNIVPFFSDPIMFYAYYSKYDPNLYQSQAVLGELEKSGFQHTVRLGRISAYSYSIEAFICDLTEGEEGYYITDVNLSGYEEDKAIFTDNGVDKLVRFYQVERSISNQCD